MAPGSGSVNVSHSFCSMCGYLAVYLELILAVIDAIGLTCLLAELAKNSRLGLLFINLVLDLTFAYSRFSCL